jgi:hypothetical protein
MKLSIYAIERVMRVSGEAKAQLESNLASLRNSAIGELSQINDASADKCMEELELFNNYVKAISKTLDSIESLMREHKAFYEMMNQ